MIKGPRYCEEPKYLPSRSLLIAIQLVPGEILPVAIEGGMSTKHRWMFVGWLMVSRAGWIAIARRIPMSEPLETALASETTNVAIATDGMVSITDHVKVEPSDTAEPAPANVDAVSLADIPGMDEAKKAQINSDLSAQRLKAGSEANNAMLLGDARTLRSISILAIQMAVFPDTDWTQEAKDIGVDTDMIKSKHPAAMAVAGTFGFKPYSDDPKVAKQHGQYLDRYALATEGFKNLILALPADEFEKITLDENGIKAVAKRLDDAGGVNQLAAEQRKANRQTPEEREWRIGLSAAKVKAHLEERGRETLLAGVKGKGSPSISLALAVEVEGKPVSAPTKLDLGSPLLSQALCSLAPVDPRVDTLGELLQVGSMVAEVKTDIPVDGLEDATDPETKKRLASRHFVLKPDGSMLISPILNSESLVVVVKTKQPILPDWPETLHHFHTFGRRKAEVNIAAPERRKLFDMRVDGRGDTLGHCRVVLTTNAAATREDAKKDVGFLVEPLRSEPGNYPLDVLDGEFATKAKLEFALDGNAQQLLFGIVRGLKSAGDEAATINLDGTHVKFNTKRQLLKLGAKTAKTGEVNVRAAHLHAVVSTLAGLPLIPDSVVTFATDLDGAVRISFTTDRADYAVFLPAVMAKGGLSNRYFPQITLD